MVKKLLILLIGFTSSFGFSADFFWIGGTGNWSDVNNWSATSGGASVGSIPSNADNVIFDALSGLSANTDTVYLDTPIQVTNFDYGLAPNFVFDNALTTIEIQGSLTANSTVTHNWLGDIILSGGLPGYFIESNGALWNLNFQITGTEAYILNDNFISNNDLIVDGGGIVTNSFNLACDNFISSTPSTRIIDISNSTLDISGLNWDVSGVNLTFTSLSSVINLNNPASTYFDGGGITYDTVKSVSAATTIVSSNTFTLLELPASSNLILNNSSTQIVDSIIMAGDCASTFNLNTTNPGNPSATIQNNGLPFSSSGLSVNNVDVTGSGFNISLSDTTNGADGWNYSGSVFYWINNGGDWSDGNHWSLSSGGPVAICTPTIVDSVIFDAQSFSAASQVVNVDVETYFSYMNWSTATNSPTLFLDTTVFSQGDVVLNPNLTVTRTNIENRFEFNEQATFNPAGSNFDCNLSFLLNTHTDSVVLAGDLLMSDSTSIFLSKGELYFQGNTVTGNTIQLFDTSLVDFVTDSKVLDFGSATINLASGINTIYGSPFVFNGGASDLTIGHPNKPNFIQSSDNLNFYDVTLNFSKTGQHQVITSSNTYNKLRIIAGSHIQFDSTTVQTINDSLVIIGNCQDSVYLYSSNPANPVDFNKATASDVAVECVDLNGINADGVTLTALFSTGNNSNWTFDSTPPVVASFTVDGPYCFGDTTMFTNNSTGYNGNPNDITSIWYFNDGSGYYVNPPSDSTWISFENDTNQHVFINGGDFDVVLETTYFNHCVSKDTNTVHINRPSIQLSSSELDKTICAGDSVIFEANSGTVGSEFQFYYNGVPVGGQSVNDTLFISNTLVDQDSISVLSFENSCPSDTAPHIVITVNNLPTFTWTSSDSDTTICAEDLVTFQASPVDSVNTYQYLINNTSASGYTFAGTHNTSSLSHNDTISLIAIDTVSCRDTLSMIFNVNPLPTTSLASSIVGNVICTGDAVTFTGTGADSYEFMVDGVSQGAPSATNTWTTSSLITGDTVTVLGYTSNGCIKAASESYTYTVNPLPSVSITSSSPLSICSGNNITFNSGGASQYEFFINSTSVQGPGSIDSYTTSTLSDNDTVFVIGSFSGCSGNSDSLIFDVVSSPTTTLTSDATANTICAQETVNFTAGGATNYEFFINGISQGTPSTVNTFSSNTLTNGQTVTVIGESNSCEVSQGISITVLPKPSVNMFSNDADNTICDGESITFTGANAVQYELFVNSVSQGAPQASAIFTPTLPVGNSEVYLIGTASNGCSDTSQTVLSVTVHPIPVITLSSSDADNIICSGESVTFTGAGSNQFQFFVDGSPQGSMSTTNTFTTTNLLNGQVVSINGSSFGCSSTSNTLTYTVNTNPTVSLTSSDIDNVFCLDESVTFTGSGATNYEFFVDGISQGPASATNTINSSGFVAGTYAVQVFGEQAGCSGSDMFNVTVNSLPIPTITSSDANDTICSGEAVTYTATGGTLYEFFINGMSLGAPATYSTTVLSTLNDNDVVSVNVSNAQGCSSSVAETAITVSPTPIVNLTSSDADNTICDGENVTFTGSGADTYEYFINGTSQGAPSAVNTFSSSTLINGDVIEINGSSLDCSSTSNSLNFTVHNIPTVNLVNNGDLEICAGESVDLSATGGTNYEFFVDGVSQGAPSTTSTFNGTVNNGETVTVSGENNGCVSTSPVSFQYIVNQYPNLSSTSTDADNIICKDEDVTFNASGANTYLFELNGGSIQNGTATSYTTSTLLDGDIISITGFNGDCPSAIDQYVFTVNEMALSMSTSPSNLICDGTPVTFTGFGADEYEFFLNSISTGTMSSTNTFSSSTLTNLDEITFTAYNNTTGCTQNYNDFVIMNVIPEPTVSANTSYTFCEGDSVILISNAPYGNQWYLDGNPIAGATDTSYVAYNTGTYSLEVTTGGAGETWSFGVNASGTFGNGNNFNNPEPTQALPTEALVELSSGYNHMLAVSETGNVYAWGDNEFGQLGNGTYTNSNSPIQIAALSNIKTVATASQSSMAVTNTGDVYVWGENIQGQLATGNTAVINFPFLNTALTNVDTIAGGKNHFLFLKNDGTVWATGNNISGQLGQNNLTQALSPVQVIGLTNIVAIGAGEYSSYAIDNTGALFVWGSNGSGQLGLGDLTNRLVPTASPLKNVKDAQGGANHSVFVTTDNELYATGGNVYGQLGLGDNVNRTEPTKVSLNGAIQISAGQYTTLVRRTDNSVFGFGTNSDYQLSSVGATINTPEHISDIEGVTFVEAGRLSSHVIFGENQLCTSQNVNTTMNTAPIAQIGENNGVLTTDAGTNYQWFLDGSIITGANSQTFTPTTSGNYSVQVTLTNGCVSSSNDYYFGMVSIAEFNAAELKIYPNPTKGLLTVNFQNFEKNGEVNLTVIDQAGRVVKSVTTLIQENIQLDLFDIESGSYQIVIQHQGFEKTVRFVKTNF